MPKPRYSDAELRLMAEAAEAIKKVMDACGYRDLLYGKWALLTSDVSQELTTRERERRTMFVGPDVQLAAFARWNRDRGWGFTLGDFIDAVARVPPPPPPPKDGGLQLKARVLEMHLPDGPDGTPGVRRTFDELWDIAVKEHGARPCHLFGLTKNVRVELMAGVAHRPGIRWRTIDLGHGWPCPAHGGTWRGTAPRSVPSGEARAHAGVLAAAAHFPLWLARMDGRSVPYVWLPGYDLQGAPHGLGALSIRPLVLHPRISGDGERKFLYYGWDHVPFDDYASPIYADDAPPIHEEAAGDGFGG